jgi:hypothetical protein
MFKRFFGKKNDGFYMQIDDAPTAKVADKAAPTPTPVAAPAKIETAAPDTITKAVATPAAPAAPATQTEKKVAAAEKAAAKAIEKAAKAEKKSKPATTATAPAPSATAPAAPAPVITNFATDYLIKPSSDSNRRRPGANMSKFLELAREAKIPVNIKK